MFTIPLEVGPFDDASAEHYSRVRSTPRRQGTGPAWKPSLKVIDFTAHSRACHRLAPDDFGRMSANDGRHRCNRNFSEEQSSGGVAVSISTGGAVRRVEAVPATSAAVTAHPRPAHLPR